MCSGDAVRADVERELQPRLRLWRRLRLRRRGPVVRLQRLTHERARRRRQHAVQRHPTAARSTAALPSRRRRLLNRPLDLQRRRHLSLLDPQAMPTEGNRRLQHFLGLSAPLHVQFRIVPAALFESARLRRRCGDEHRNQRWNGHGYPSNVPRHDRRGECIRERGRLHRKRRIARRGLGLACRALCGARGARQCPAERMRSSARWLMALGLRAGWPQRGKMMTRRVTLLNSGSGVRVSLGEPLDRPHQLRWAGDLTAALQRLIEPSRLFGLYSRAVA